MPTTVRDLSINYLDGLLTSTEYLDHLILKLVDLRNSPEPLDEKAANIARAFTGPDL